MSFFRLEIFNEKGRTIELRHINLPGVTTVEKALVSKYVNNIKRDARERGFGFRVKREDE
jgi:hypothetical protein